MTTTHRVHRLSTTPVKGFALHHPKTIRLDASGAVGDRDLFVVDERDRLLSIGATGVFAGATASFDAESAALRLVSAEGEVVEGPLRLGAWVTTRFSPSSSVAGREVEGPFGAWLSELAGRRVRLVRADVPGAGSDVRPVTILGTASVAELAARAGDEIDARRFRMLIDLETAAPHVEDTWSGGTLTGDEVRLRVLGPVPRCAAITRHPDRGERDLPLVRAIRDYRGITETEAGPGACFGVYAEVLTPGLLRVGEELALEV